MPLRNPCGRWWPPAAARQEASGKNAYGSSTGKLRQHQGQRFLRFADGLIASLCAETPQFLAEIEVGFGVAGTAFQGLLRAADDFGWRRSKALAYTQQGRFNQVDTAA